MGWHSAKRRSAEGQPAELAARSRLRVSDAFTLGALGLRGRPLRATLSALGIALGIAAVVGVLGLSASSQAGALREISGLGTDMLSVQAGQDQDGNNIKLPAHAAGSVARLPGVRDVGWTAGLTANVYRSRLMDRGSTAGLRLTAASANLPKTVSATLAQGRWLNPATSRFPVAVLGAKAASRLGISVLSGQLIDIGGHQARVVGILAPSVLEGSLDTAVLIGPEAARTFYGWDGHPEVIYVRSSDAAVAGIRTLLPGTANPRNPLGVAVSRPSDALVAKLTTSNAFTSLFLGLGAVALLVGGVGVANVMVISVLERRGEIGLRRALGARRPHVAVQFALEALFLATLGGVCGAALGAAITVGYARLHQWDVVIPVSALVSSAGASIVVGAIAGLYPAIRASRVSPTQALAAL